MKNKIEIPGSFVGIERVRLIVGGQKIILTVYDGFENRSLLESLGHLKKEKCICFFDICMRIIDMRRDDLETDTLEFICAECPCAKGISDGQIPQVRNHIKFLEKGNALRSVLGIEAANEIDVPLEKDIGEKEKRKAKPKRQIPTKNVASSKKDGGKKDPADDGFSMPISDGRKFVFAGGAPVYRIFCGSEDITASFGKGVDGYDQEKIKVRARYLGKSVIGIRVVEYSEEFPKGKDISLE